MVKVKICGITSEEDALMAVKEGADALGFVFYKDSPRYVLPALVRKITQSLPPFVATVGVFVDEDIAKVLSIVNFCRLSGVQLHGEEPPFYCEKIEAKIIKGFRLKNSSVLEKIRNYPKISAVLLDSYDEELPGGTGKPLDLKLAAKAADLGLPVIAAGGIAKNNVRKVVSKLKPYAIDVCSSLESEPGKKDPAKVADFFKVVRSLHQ
jgi:phosphoribosylanthranilate isomerase